MFIEMETAVTMDLQKIFLYKALKKILGGPSYGSQLKHDRTFRKRSDAHHFHDSSLYADESSLSPPPLKLSSARNGAIAVGLIQKTEFRECYKEVSR
jgi:hypothetical protein